MIENFKLNCLMREWNCRDSMSCCGIRARRVLLRAFLLMDNKHSSKHLAIAIMYENDPIPTFITHAPIHEAYKIEMNCIVIAIANPMGVFQSNGNLWSEENVQMISKQEIYRYSNALTTLDIVVRRHHSPNRWWNNENRCKWSKAQKRSPVSIPQWTKTRIYSISPRIHWLHRKWRSA